jgi:hypothetical protein
MPMSIVVLDVPALAKALALLSPEELESLADVLECARDRSPWRGELRPHLTVREAAGLAGVAPKTIQNWLSDGRLIRHGVPRRPLVDRVELENLLRPRESRITQIHRSAPKRGSARFTARARAA